MDREDFARRLAEHPSAFVRAFATHAREGACWGNLADAFVAADAPLEDRLALWEVLVDLGAREPLLLFVDLHAKRPEVLATIAADAPNLPGAIQCALASLGVALPKGAHGAARELACAPESIRAPERVLYAAHAGALRGLRIPVAT